MTDFRVSPPIAQVIPQIIKLHNREYQDDYEYMNDRNNPVVQNYISAENQFTAMIVEETVPLQLKLREEFKSRVKGNQNMASLIPTSRCYYEYIQCFPPGHAYPRFCRKVAGSKEEFHTMLDLNDPKFHANGNETYLTVGAIDVSPDGTLLAFSLDHTGEERFQIYIFEINLQIHNPNSQSTNRTTVRRQDSRHNRTSMAERL